MSAEGQGPLGALHSARVMIDRGLKALVEAEGRCVRDSADQFAQHEQAERDRDALQGAVEDFLRAWWEFDGLDRQTHFNAVAEYVEALDHAYTQTLALNPQERS